MKPIRQHISQLAIAAVASIALIPLTAMAEGYLVDSNGKNVMSSDGLCWHISEWSPASYREPCDPAYKPVAAVVPAPVVAPAPAPAPPLRKKISFSGSALFAFDKSALKPEGMALMDNLVQQLNSTTYETIEVTGHTDRIGSDVYNQKLSERRAQSVKDYLVSKGVPANSITAIGKGETAPSETGECKGMTVSRTKACLQLDRRVDIEMIGTKPVAGSN
ncbi:OmpA family protein [uncultured Amphritea sp.]|uniref:OmpA family protein n=1 Tax=uncultured Amphritea sp. TaxID=981605 RepID=UPI002626A63F|nr:OmpA family protein [uncultured Amphritea sp.]